MADWRRWDSATQLAPTQAWGSKMTTDTCGHFFQISTCEASKTISMLFGSNQNCLVGLVWPPCVFSIEFGLTQKGSVRWCCIAGGNFTVSGNASKKLGAKILKLRMLYPNTYIYIYKDKYYLYIYICMYEVYTYILHIHVSTYIIHMYWFLYYNYIYTWIQVNPSNAKEGAEVVIKSNKHHLTGGKQ